jgi:hypothetical protein
MQLFLFSKEKVASTYAANKRKKKQMADVAGIGALLRPNKYSILKFVDIHPGVF